MADLDATYDEQDQSEVFDEDNTNDMDRGPGEEAEQLEDLVDVYDVTSAVGDDDDDDALIGDEMDDAEIVAAASDDDEDDDDTEDDLVRRDQNPLDHEADLTDATNTGDEELDEVDGIAARDAGEVELEYVGDLHDLANAHSAAQDLEADNLSDQDLRELDYKDEVTADEGGASART